MTFDQKLYQNRMRGYQDGITAAPYSPPKDRRMAMIYAAGYTKGELDRERLSDGTCDS